MKDVDKQAGQFTTPTPGRIIYPKLTKEAVERAMAKWKGDARYTVDALFEPTDPTYAALKAKAIEIAKLAFPDRKIKQFKIEDPTTHQGLAFPFIDGTMLADADDKGAKEFYRGMGCFRASSPNPVTTGRVNADGSTTLCEPVEIYGGCFAYLQVNFRPYPEIGNIKLLKDYSPPGVKAFLNGVLFARDGERIGGSRDLSQMFSGVVGHAVAADPRAPKDGDEEGI